MTDQKTKTALKIQERQIKALLVANPKQIDQTIFNGYDESIISAHVNSYGEAWVSSAPIDDYQCDKEAMTTSTNYPMGIKVGDGYDPRGWDKSLISRQQEDTELKIPAGYSS